MNHILQLHPHRSYSVLMAGTNTWTNATSTSISQLTGLKPRTAVNVNIQGQHWLSLNHMQNCLQSFICFHNMEDQLGLVSMTSRWRAGSVLQWKCTIHILCIHKNGCLLSFTYLDFVTPFPGVSGLGSKFYANGYPIGYPYHDPYLCKEHGADCVTLVKFYYGNPHLEDRKCGDDVPYVCEICP